MSVGHRRLRVLVSAYACSPSRGSEPGVGWGFVSELSKHHDLDVIVESSFAEEIGAHQASAEQPCGANFFFVPRRRIRLLEKIWPPSYYWTYRKWHLDAYRLAESLTEVYKYDLAHQLTMVGYREPGFFWKLKLPFVWGPVGGMGYFPWSFLHVVGLYGAAYYLCYNLVNWVQARWMKRPALAARRAGLGFVAATSENERLAALNWGVLGPVISEVGVPPSAVTSVAPTRRAESTPIRILWSGQHTPGKALNLGLLALSRLPSEIAWELDVLGGGARTEAWRRLASRLGIADRCRFHGTLPRQVALQVMASCHLTMITSLRDLTSSVTIEAFSLGHPVICPDHCGFSDAVDESCGIRVSVRGPEAMIAGLQSAICKLATDESLRLKLAYGALTKAQAYSWPVKAEALSAVYARRLLTGPNQTSGEAGL